MNIGMRYTLTAMNAHDLPALLALFGERFARQFRAKAEKRAAKGKELGGGARWRRWAGLVQRRPLVSLVLAVAALGALSAPALDLRLGFADAGNDAAKTTSRKAYDLLADGSPGFNGRSSSSRRATARRARRSRGR